LLGGEEVHLAAGVILWEIEIAMALHPPTLDYVMQQQRDNKNKTDYFEADTTVNLVFSQWPKNSDKDQVLSKVLVLDSLYSTSVYYPDALAEHIISLSIDGDMQNGDPTLVERIASVNVGKGPIRYYSFATKYCSFHNPSAYHIFDSYIEKLVWAYQKSFKFSSFRRYEPQTSYDCFAAVLSDLVAHFGLEGLSKKALDKFLWIEGMKHFPKYNA
jgi:hypothetical protein